MRGVQERAAAARGDVRYDEAVDPLLPSGEDVRVAGKAQRHPAPPSSDLPDEARHDVVRGSTLGVERPERNWRAQNDAIVGIESFGHLLEYIRWVPSIQTRSPALIAHSHYPGRSRSANHVAFWLVRRHRLRRRGGYVGEAVGRPYQSWFPGKAKTSCPVGVLVPSSSSHARS